MAHSISGPSDVVSWKWQQVEDLGLTSTMNGRYTPKKFYLTYRSCTTSQRRIFLPSQLQNRSLISAKTSSSAVSNETPLSVQQQSNFLKIPGSRASKKWSATPKTKKPTPQSQNKAKNNSQPASSIYRIHTFFRRLRISYGIGIYT
jgi:hypothetical protein